MNAKRSLLGSIVVFALACSAVAQSPATPSPVSAAVPAAVPTTVAAPATTPSTLVLREGEDVPLKFAQDVSSKTAADGDPVMFVLASDLSVGKVVVAKEGSKAYGEITDAHKAGMMGKPGELNLRLDYLKVGDTKVHLRGSKGKEGESGTTATVALTVLFGPIGLIKHGHDINIKEGTALTVYVADDVTLAPAMP